MQIHLVRHGKTAANEKRLYCGQTDLPLSENGFREIALLTKQGIYPPADIFFTSGFLRAEQTLQLIRGEVNRIADPRLAEFNFGLFEMKSHDELKDSADYQAWITDETGNAECPRGESNRQFETRVLAGYNAVVEETSKKSSALVVCHGGVIACIMAHLHPGTRNFYEWLPEPGRGYTLFTDKTYEPI
jgi:alpha-ribazole phosphatase